MKTPSLDFDRWDYGATKLMALGAMVVVPTALLLSSVVPWIAGDALTWTTSLPDAPAVTDPVVADGARAVWDGSAVVTLQDPSGGLRLAALLPDVVTAIAIALVAWALWGVVRAIERGESFTGAVVTRLRVVGMTLVLAPWLHQVAAGVVGSLVVDQAFDRFLALTITVDGASLAVSALGLAVGALAEAFRQGVALRDDVDGLV